MIQVTKPYLPSKKRIIEYLDEIYSNEWLTNNGPLLRKYEQRLCDLLGVQDLLYVNNGTIAIQLSIKALDLKGEIITTPFSYVATTSSIVWENCTPVFVDINENSLNIDVGNIESAITPRTTGILATHCFGNACDIESIEAIASKSNIKVIYDAAHCFGTNYKGKSIFNYGDISTTSLHATKIIHSVEGGLIFANNESIFRKLHFMRNFGHDGPEKFFGLGINGKNSEFHAAMGLCVLDDYYDIMAKRKMQSLVYDEMLKGLPLKKQEIEKYCEPNFSYYPLIFDSESTTLMVKGNLEEKGFFTRRYFYPSLNNLPYVKKVDCPISDKISTEILCLPLFHTLNQEDQEVLCNIIRNSLA
jgi:dTDP-4-amino-4,6-dideoxygalactose transaminase